MLPLPPPNPAISAINSKSPLSHQDYEYGLVKLILTLFDALDPDHSNNFLIAHNLLSHSALWPLAMLTLLVLNCLCIHEQSIIWSLSQKLAL